MRAEELTVFNVSMKNTGIARVTFNRPDCLNGLTHRVARNLVENINQAQMDNAVLVLVLTGSCRALCADDNISAQNKNISDEPFMQPIPGGRDNEICTYVGLRDQ